MKKTKIKRLISATLILGMLFSVCMVATASDTSAATKNSLHSQGAIRYREGTNSVVIDSADLYTLADRLDSFKVRVTQQLGTIGTYLSKSPEGTPLTSDTGIYAVHQKPLSANETDPLSLSFDVILEGIAASQTIPTDSAAYGMGSGATLYKDAAGMLHTDKRADSEEICIQAATAENLSAGTAAWVNGRLILGTGGDNKAYHDQGYQKGTDDQGGNNDNDDNKPDNPDDVNKARIIPMNSGSDKYIVQEDMTDVFLCFSRVNSRTTPILSSGEPIKHIVQNEGTWAGHLFYNWDMYYISKLTKGTVISNLCTSKADNYMSMLITIENSSKNGKVTGLRLANASGVKDYVVENDLTDVFLYTGSSKDTMPNFTPMDDQDYVSFKLLKAVNQHCDDGNLGYTVNGCLYYIPKLKAGTKISNINLQTSYLVY